MGAAQPDANGVSFSDEVVRRFGVDTDLAHACVAALYRVLCETETDETRAAVAWWKSHVADASGIIWDRPSPAIERLTESYEIPTQWLRPAEMLFAVHSYFAIVVKLLVWGILEGKRESDAPALPCPAGSASDASRTREVLQRAESLDLLHDLGSGNASGADPFAWYAAESDSELTETLRLLVETVMGCANHAETTGGEDIFGRLYQGLFTKKVRHALGEYYTPNWLAEHVLDQVGFDGRGDGRLLDPSCGSGIFLLGAIRRVIASCKRVDGGREIDPDALCQEVLDRVVGFDLNPVAVLSARANYVLAIRHLLPHGKLPRIPVHLTDSIREGVAGEPFDWIVGNPPWIAWDHLPTDYRELTQPLWREYGLFSLTGTAARHGGAKKDLSTLMLYACADRHLKDGGRLGMVVTQTLFQTKGAGDGFRRFRLGEDGPPLRVLRVDDLTSFQPFRDTVNWTATIVLEKGSPTEYPVPYVKWSLRERRPDEQEVKWRESFEMHVCQAEPIDREKVTSPWLVWPRELELNVAQLTGPSEYTGRLGANSGGANGVYWLEVLGAEAGGVRVRNMPSRGKLGVPLTERVIEPDLVYPLLRWGDVARYRAVPKGHLLLAQDAQRRVGIDEDLMREQYPQTYDYLLRYRKLLTERAAYRRYQQSAPFYSMYNVGPYTLSSVKVVWRRMDKRINAAVVEEVDDPLLGRRCLIPQETCVLIAVTEPSEAYYLSAVLNSSLVSFLVRSHSVVGGKSFGTPSMLDYLKIPQFSPHDSDHQRLVAAAREAHRLAVGEEGLEAIEAEIDELSRPIWGLSEGDLTVIQREVMG